MRSLVRLLLLRFLGRTERRVISAILLTAMIPLVGSVLAARTVIARISATAFQPEFGEHLDRTLLVYADLVKAIKQSMRYEADAIAGSAPLRAAASTKDPAAARQALEPELARQFTAHPTLVSLAVETGEGVVLAKRERDKPVDPAVERTLTVRRPLSDAPSADEADLVLSAIFATPSSRLAEAESAQEFAQAYHQIERDHRDVYLDETYRGVFGVLLGFTVLAAIIAGVLVVRPVTNRIARLAAATRPVAEGDLSVRVADAGKDEVADLGRAFNRMLEELESSRARIEFLRRMSEWQKMARRLAHEIKNPLTPIQLAVEECHRRYTGDDSAYRRIVQTTLEVVGEEVGTLRRLVSEFSSFARLPRADLAAGDLAEFLREQKAHFAAGDEDAPLSGSTYRKTPEAEESVLAHADVSFDVPEGALPAAMDREMLHRVLTNLVRNSAQALRDSKRRGRVEVRLVDEGARFKLTIDDDGPGIPAPMRSAVFDPYVTTKKDGTGLGLAIVKKVVVDHGGTIDALESPLGGARFQIRIPRAGTPASQAAIERAAGSTDDERRRSVPPISPR